MEKEYLNTLVKRIAADSDEGAARELFNIFHPKLVRFAVFYTTSVHDANDIVSEVFIKFFRRLKKINEIRDLQYYLYKSVKNQCLTHLRKNRKHISLDELDWDNGSYSYELRNPENELLSKELNLKVEEAINNMPVKRKMVYKMVVIDGLKYKEAAELLGLSVKTIENHLVLAVKELRREIEGYLQSNDMDLQALYAMYKKNS